MKLTTFKIFSGGESCLEWENSLKEITKRWHVLCGREAFILPIVTSLTIRDAVQADPERGQLLIGVYDDLNWPEGSSIRRDPRGYMLVWKTEEIDEK